MKENMKYAKSLYRAMVVKHLVPPEATEEEEQAIKALRRQPDISLKEFIRQNKGQFHKPVGKLAEILKAAQ